MPAEQQFCTFCLNGQFIGVEVQQVQEVIRHQSMTHLPLAPKLVGGLINLRGQIVTAIDLRCRLGLAEREARELPMNVVVKSDEGPVSLLVDEIGDVVEVAQDRYEAPPDTLQGEARQLIRGVYKLKDSLLHVLKMENVIKTTPGQTQEAVWGNGAGVPSGRQVIKRD